MNVHGFFGWNFAFPLEMLSEDGGGAINEGTLAFHERKRSTPQSRLTLLTLQLAAPPRVDHLFCR